MTHARAGDIERVGLKAYLDFYGPRAHRIGSAWVLRADEAPDSPMLNRIVGLGVDTSARVGVRGSRSKTTRPSEPPRYAADGLGYLGGARSFPADRIGMGCFSRRVGRAR